MDTDDVELDLILLDEAVWQAKVALHTRVAEARADGMTWQAIAEALGVSRQACQERFTRALPGQRPQGRVSPSQRETLW